MNKQKGVTTVEFTIIGTVLIIVLFGVIEVARALFVWNTIAEATRRGARVAAVCPVNHSAIPRLTVFRDGTGSATDSLVLKGLTTANVDVDYLDPAGRETAVAGNIRFVRVGIGDVRVDGGDAVEGIPSYMHTMIIPFIMPTLTIPPFATTVPAESLGFIPGPDTELCFTTPT